MEKTAKQSYTPAIAVMFALFFMIAFVTNLAGSMGKKIGWKDGFRAIYCILKYGLFG